jgi:hypothetical protein
LRILTIIRKAATQAIKASSAPALDSGTTKGGGDNEGDGVVVGVAVGVGVNVDAGDAEGVGVGSEGGVAVGDGTGVEVGVGEALGPESPTPNGVPVRAIAGRVPIIVCGD